ncbi:MAG: septum formation protein Maf [Elusimicrobia bacterium]|nr:septum formation protein Maf [Elusimicrobiota bacterium]
MTTKKPDRRPPFILASGSPRRRKLLRGVVSSFQVVESGVPEPPPRKGTDVRVYVQRLARWKALAVARRIRFGLVLGADTVVVRRGEIFGKPQGRAEARRMLSDLSGKWHEVYTGLALAARPGTRVWTAVARTRVRMQEFSAAELGRLATRHHDKAGAYAAQARGNPFVQRYQGDFDNIVGLPRRTLRVLLGRARRAGFSLGAGSSG